MDMAPRHERSDVFRKSSVPPGRRRALLVEELPLDRQIAKLILECDAFENRLAADGAEAVEAVAGGEVFDVVLSTDV